MTRDSTSDPLCVTGWVCSYLAVPIRTFRRWRAAGKFPPPDVRGRPNRWRRSTVERWIDSQVNGNGSAR